jgi:predicted dehydrogenase
MTDLRLISGRDPRVAVIGAGHMGRHHARIYSEIPDCELVAVVDKDLDRARKIAREFGGRPAAGVLDVAEEFDAASVAVPTVYHGEVAIPLLERGVAVLVEKPLAPDVESAGKLLEAARRTGSILQVGHSERFNPVVQAMLRMKVLPRFIETHRISPFTFRSADIGVVLDMMIHDIDSVLHLVSGRAALESAPRLDPGLKGDRIGAGSADFGSFPAYTVDAAGVNVLGDFEDVANARVRFSNGAVVNMTASRLALKTERKIRVFCPTAYLSMDYQKKTGIAVMLKDNVDLIRLARERNFEDLSQMASLDYGSMLKIENLSVDDREPLRVEIESFLHSVRTGESTGVSAEDGFAAVEMAERITRAIREHSWGDEIAPFAAAEEERHDV